MGRALCETLVRRFDGGGPRLRVPTRHAAHAKTVQALPLVDVLVGDVHDDAALAQLVAGCSAVVNLVAILHDSEAAFEAAHVTLPRRLAAACASNGVRRLVHISALGVGENAPSHYLRSKARGEAVLKAAGLDLTLLRPSVIFGAQDRFMNTFAALQALAPLVPLAGADARFQPVWVEDVAQAIAACLARPDTAGQTIECSGPEVLTLAELVRLAGRYSGHPRPVLPLPGPLARLQAMLMELAPGEPLMTRDNLDSMRVPNVASGTLPGPGLAGHHGHGPSLRCCRPTSAACSAAAGWTPSAPITGDTPPMKVFEVGGAVRDALLGRPVQDRDWVVVGSTPEAMLAAGFRPVGKDFPVFLHPETGEEYALARTERKTARGYHGFVFHTAPEVTLEDDLVRRDLTINAMARSADGTLVDPHGGQQDLAAKVLRHVSTAFAEDPVRILRLARFAARFASLHGRPQKPTR